jgi:two-component system, NarL family, sensor histidine kinase UhpB
MRAITSLAFGRPETASLSIAEQRPAPCCSRKNELAVSLRSQLVLSIALVLLICLAIDGVFAYWHAVSKVDTEIRAALEVGARTVRDAVGDRQTERLPRQPLESLVTDFNGDRHLRVSLVDNAGAAVAASSPLVPSEPAPRWFYRVLASPSMIVRTDLPASSNAYSAIVLEADPRNEIGEAWSDIVLSLAVLATFCGLVLLLVYWMIGRALRPLHDLSVAFSRIGHGDYATQIIERGPPELARICRGFNQMARCLNEMEVRNRHLAEQLAIVEDEERSDLACDLHDEIGPLLFAVSVDLASIRQQNGSLSGPTIVPRLDAIRDAVSQMQRHVKSILGRLRPPTLLDLGPAHAVDNLIVFWQARYPAAVFDVDMPLDSFGRAIDEQIYRIIQESLNNALRHGRAQHIAIVVRLNADGVIAVDVSDDGVGFQAANGAGFALLGMQERVQSLGGTLSAGNRHDRSGVIVSARLPYSIGEARNNSNVRKTSAA